MNQQAPDICGIVLRNGDVVIVDMPDVEAVVSHEWSSQGYTRASGERNAYAFRRQDGQYVRLHRLLLGIRSDDPRDVDHVNGNGLDNRRVNLRAVTRAQNLANKRSVSSVCGFKGVQPGRSGNYVARCGRKWLGTFRTAEEAAAAYDAAALKQFGEHAATNAQLRALIAPKPTRFIVNWFEVPPARKPVPRDPKRLSPRELEIETLLADGSSINSIAAQLCISPKTVSCLKLRARAKRALAAIQPSK